MRHGAPNGWPMSPICDTYRRPAQMKKPAYAGFSRADARTRTGDPFITSEVLYQLSYVGGLPS
jgi:hypothetical protein